MSLQKEKIVWLVIREKFYKRNIIYKRNDKEVGMIFLLFLMKEIY